jgi:hypothetical protein
MALVVLGAPAAGAAQFVGPPPTAADSVKAGRPARPLPPSAVAARARFRPPLTPRRAFIYSAMLPGLGQSRLDRGTAGALFASIELASMVMVRRSLTDWREAKRFQADTLPADFTIGSDGKAVPSGRIISRYSADLVRTRRLHLEDWLAVVAFNHLFAGAEAFVSAQLWDSPVDVSAVPTRNGWGIVASLPLPGR